MNNNRWTISNIPEQTGRTVIVTGSSSGIGFEAARVLANKNAKVIIAVRNLDKGNVAKLKSSNIKVTAAHPGWTATDLQRHSKVFEFMNNFFAMKPEQGSLPTLSAAIDEYANSGDYFGPDGWQEWKGYPVKVDTNKLAKDETIAKKLWDVSENLTGAIFNDGL